jgi:hypothetical protein
MADINVGRLLATLSLKSEQFSKGLKSAERQLERFSRKMVKIGAMMSISVTAPLAAIGGAAVKAASDAEELENAFSVVFGRSAQEAQVFFDDLSKRIGRSAVSLKEYGTELQSIIAPMVGNREEAAKLSMRLTELASDVGSLRNKMEPEVIMRFVSGLAGETEAVRRLGIDIGQTAVEHELFRMGVQGVWKEVSQANKIIARANIIVRDSRDAWGDAERTLASFQNQWKRLLEALKDAKIAIGNQLLPSATKVVTALGDLIDKFNALTPAMQKTVVEIGSFLAALGPAAVLIGIIGLALGKLGIAIVAVTGLVVGFGIYVANQWDLVTNAIAQDIGRIILAVHDFADQVLRIFEEVFRGIHRIVRRAFEGLPAFIRDFGPVKGILEGLEVYSKGAADGVAALRTNLANSRETVQGYQNDLKGAEVTMREAKATADEVAKAGGLGLDLAGPPSPGTDRGDDRIKERKSALREIQVLTGKLSEYDVKRLEATDRYLERMQLLKGDHAALLENVRAWHEELKQIGQEEMQTLLDAVGDVVGQFATVAQTAIKDLVSGTKEWGQALKDLLGTVLDIVANLIIAKTVEAALGGITSFVGGIFTSQKGGLFTKPSVTAIAEKEPEMAIPLSKLKGLSGGSMSVHIENNAPVEVEAEERRGPGGEQSLHVLINRAVAQNIERRGVVSRSLESTYTGIQRRTRTR